MTQKIINNTLADDRVKENYIFISDIHGNHETLGLIEQAKKDFPYAQLVTGGDYIDGRDSVKEVLDYLIEQKVKVPLFYWATMNKCCLIMPMNVNIKMGSGSLMVVVIR